MSIPPMPTVPGCGRGRASLPLASGSAAPRAALESGLIWITCAGVRDLCPRAGVRGGGPQDSLCSPSLVPGLSFLPSGAAPLPSAGPISPDLSPSSVPPTAGWSGKVGAASSSARTGSSSESGKVGAASISAKSAPQSSGTGPPPCPAPSACGILSPSLPPPAGSSQIGSRSVVALLSTPGPE